MEKEKLKLSDVLKWGISEFGYMGHLKKLSEIIGMEKSYFKGMKRRGTRYVNEKYTDILVNASKGKLKPVKVK